MSFFGRIGNLAKGAWITRTNPREGLSDADLEKELARPRRAPPEALKKPPAAPKEEPPKPRGPERDEHGNIKKTL